MATHKLIEHKTDGSQQEYAGKNTSAGAGDAGEFVVLDSSGKIDISMMPNGVAADATSLTAGEALAAGDFVYINGTSQVLKADATAVGKQAMGYVLTAAANAAAVTVYFDESNTAKTGLTPGAKYFLSTTPGGVTTTSPTTAGNISQELGFAINATTLHVNLQEPVIRQ